MSTINIAIVGGGMFFDGIIGQSFKDLMRGGLAPGLSSIVMSHLAPKVSAVDIEVIAIGSHRPDSGTAERIAAWFAEDLSGRPIKAGYGSTVWK